MRVELRDSFVEKLTDQVDYIAIDKPGAARKFKEELLTRIKKLKEFPFKCRKSIYFNDSNIRDLTFSGYIVVYEVDSEAKSIVVFALVKSDDFQSES